MGFFPRCKEIAVGEFWLQETHCLERADTKGITVPKVALLMGTPEARFLFLKNCLDTETCLPGCWSELYLVTPQVKTAHQLNVQCISDG